MNTFESMGLPEALRHTLQHIEFITPTPIQEQAIPMALAGRDVLGSAQTGTGKTGAFGIPLVAHLMNNATGSALVMTPTRELATQVMAQLQAMLGKRSNIKTALLIGGEPIGVQLRQLHSRPRLVVGTPGRINDHLKRSSLNLRDANFLVLDETDRMLDMGFTVQIEDVIGFMAKERQTLLFSATLPKNIVQISKKYLINPASVSLNATSTPATNIKQDILRVNEAEKYTHLLNQLGKREGSILVFVKTKYGTEKMAVRLSKEGHSVDAIHGDLRQNKRDRVIAAFRKKKYRILVATDVAARGLDIPHIEHVINYDMPQCPEDYIHRIGRTARAGAEGSALNLVTPADRSKWEAIDYLLNPGTAKRPSAATDPSKQKRYARGGREGKGNAFAPRADRKKWDGTDRSFGPNAERRSPSATPSSPFQKRRRVNVDGNDKGGKFTPQKPKFKFKKDGGAPFSTQKRKKTRGGGGPKRAA